MDKKAQILTFIVVSTALIAQPSIANALVGFLLVGAIPGTSYSLPSWLMLLGYLMTAAGIIALVVAAQKTAARQAVGKPAKNRMPHRRYSHI